MAKAPLSPCSSQQDHILGMLHLKAQVRRTVQPRRWEGLPAFFLRIARKSSAHEQVSLFYHPEFDTLSLFFSH